MDSPIDFHRRIPAPRESEFVNEALHRGSLAGGGTATRACEAEISRRCSQRPAVLTPSCSSALELAALAMGIGPGDEVIVPSFGFPTTAGAFALRGATIRFVDVEQRWLGVDPSRLEPLVTDRTKAVVVIHYGGVAADIESIRTVLADDVVIVEDAAHGFAATWRGEPLGTLGHLGAFSFHDTKHVAAGEAGALVVVSELESIVETLREKGTDRSRFLRGEIDRYVWQAVGGSHLPSELQAAVLAAQLEVVESSVAVRQELWRQYAETLGPWAEHHGLLTMRADADRSPPAHQFHVVLGSVADRVSLSNHLAARGVDARFHFQPLHRSPAARQWSPDLDSCPVTDSIADGLLRLPFHAGLNETDVQRVIDAVRSWRPVAGAAAAVER